MSIIDSTVYVIVINHKVILDGICDSLEEAITDINYHDKHGIIPGHKMQVYKATIRELIEFYKGYRSATDIEKHIDRYLTQVYPDPSNNSSLEDLAEGLKHHDECHNNNDLNICPIYGVMMSHATK